VSLYRLLLIVTILAVPSFSADGTSAWAQEPDEAPVPDRATTRSHDWRVPGFPSVVGGRLYDAACLPMASVGSNVPNLAFRAGAPETLQWLGERHVRWMRVFATGHTLDAERAPKSAAASAAALRNLLSSVERHNDSRPPNESVFVLVVLTNYYPPGVPGDRYAFDHPGFDAAPVLPAPWYRAGARLFDFEQEHGKGRLSDLQNYEVNYKPWVREIVSSLSDSPALLGWQLGNELKARNSQRNDISPTEAFGWYLDFTRDMVDTIREYDRNHLVFTGAQYLAELVDWEYRGGGRLDSEMLPTYHEVVQHTLDACNDYCWNVWGLSGYDSNVYPVDDALAFQSAGVAAMFTELGHTRREEGSVQSTALPDRAQVVRHGAAGAWTDISGRGQPSSWSVHELFDRAGISGVAPWGSPAPSADAAVDADVSRGITFAPDEVELWAAWSEVGAGREAANRRAGPSSECLAFDSEPRLVGSAERSACRLAARGGTFRSSSPGAAAPRDDEPPRYLMHRDRLAGGGFCPLDVEVGNPPRL
jgi:hypothetical protein